MAGFRFSAIHVFIVYSLISVGFLPAQVSVPPGQSPATSGQPDANFVARSWNFDNFPANGDGFVFIQDNEIRLTGAVGRPRNHEGDLVVGIVEPDGQIATRSIHLVELTNSDFTVGLRGGKVYIRREDSSAIAVNLHTGEPQVVEKDDHIYNSLFPVERSSQFAGSRAVWMRAGSEEGLKLVVEDSAGANRQTIWEHVYYSTPSDPTGQSNSPPPLAWLDDHHLLTIHSTPAAATSPENDKVVVIDTRSKNIQEIGSLKRGYIAIMPPRGSDGDAAFIDSSGQTIQDRSFAVNVRSAITGQGQLEPRSVHWGRFTITHPRHIVQNGTRLPPAIADSDSYRFVNVEALALGDKELAKNVVISISPDGKRILWRNSPDDPESPQSLCYCDSTDGKIQEVASGLGLQLPIWVSQSDFFETK